MGGYGFGVMGLGMVLITVFWVSLIVLVVWAVSRLFQQNRRNDRDSAIEVLRRRYAAGEISEAEYQQAVKTLG